MNNSEIFCRAPYCTTFSGQSVENTSEIRLDSRCILFCFSPFASTFQSIFYRLSQRWDQYVERTRCVRFFSVIARRARVYRRRAPTNIITFLLYHICLKLLSKSIKTSCRSNLYSSETMPAAEVSTKLPKSVPGRGLEHISWCAKIRWNFILRTLSGARVLRNGSFNSEHLTTENS